MLVGIKHKLSRTVACEDKSEKSQLDFLDRDGSIWGLVTFGDLKQKMCNFFLLKCSCVFCCCHYFNNRLDYTSLILDSGPVRSYMSWTNYCKIIKLNKYI